MNDAWETPEGLDPPRLGGDGRGAWRPSDEGPPDPPERPDPADRPARRSDADWMTAAGWVRDPPGSRWVRPGDPP